MQLRVVTVAFLAAALVFTAAAAAQLPDPDDVTSDVEGVVNEATGSGGSSSEEGGSGSATSDGEDLITVEHEDGSSGGDASTADGSATDSSDSANGADSGSGLSDEGTDTPALGLLLSTGAVLIALIVGRRFL